MATEITENKENLLKCIFSRNPGGGVIYQGRKYVS